MRPEKLFLPALATGLATILATTAIPAAAQTPNLMNPGPVVGTPSAKTAPLPPPPGLPGAVHNSGTPAPRAPSESGLSPTAVLFDAINRGDLGAAREAIGRGAQLDAKNVLGMTPLELAVDLDRNDIAFLLLSIEHESRAAASSAGASLALSMPPAPAASAASRAARAQPATPPADQSVAALLAAAGPVPAPGAPAPGAPASKTRAARPPPPAAVPLAGGTGSPNPAVGFLGFGPSAGGAGGS
ncbi:MAG: hypothetical protein ACREFJ_08355 [Acetobacteraceae bacterium]